MTDEQIEQLIWSELRKKKITLNDMLGGDYIDPDPNDKSKLRSQRYRQNRFRETFSEHRMKELLCVGEYNPYNDLPALKVSLQDLFRFWWENCIAKELFVDEILQDIFEHFADQMKPMKDEPDQMDLTLNFEQLPLFVKDRKQAA